ncbi:MAG: hypothetical protein SGI74_02470 [Oligoflexia bacterium]|nr:hypothetical protein [Oligoflexia bacterium]
MKKLYLVLMVFVTLITGSAFGAVKCFAILQNSESNLVFEGNWHGGLLVCRRAKASAKLACEASTASACSVIECINQFEERGVCK